ncbi:hypothetical protein BaRGS_00031742 [Batillaria attramentaria]|uniref:Uncharacterized protein n=1 Tax=Batillaria attramentaria TaxID=370345 RepID=A0ABD0JRB0_9CAEN
MRADQSTLKRVGLNWPNIRKNDMHQYTRITSLLATDCGRLLMADILNQSVKELKLSKLTNTRQRASPVECAVEPWGLAILEDGKVAVTSATSNCICLRDIKGSKGGWWPFGGLKGSKVNVIKTVRKYCGVACGGNSTLIVSCKSEGDKPAGVDIIGLTGELLRTIVTSRQIDDLKCPDYIHMVQGELLIADHESHAVLRLNFPTGKLMAVHEHKDLKNPCQITSDRLGNVYVASNGGRCILAIRADGKWRNLLKADDLRNLFSSVEHLNPHSVTVTTDSQPTLIVGWQNDQSGSAVTCHVKEVMS